MAVPGPSTLNGSTGSPAIHYPNPNVQNNPHVYMAVYSSIAVYEMMIRGVGVMRRRSDSYMNATQILKVAGVDKAKRTKILDKEIVTGEHEKIQGGYGRYQGTWIPFWRAQELAAQFGVTQILSPLFDYTPGPAAASASPLGALPVSTHANYAVSSPANGNGLLHSHTRDHAGEAFADQAKRIKADLEGPQSSGRLANGLNPGALDSTNSASDLGMGLESSSDSMGIVGYLRKSNPSLQPAIASIGDDPLKIEKHRHILMSVFVYADPSSSTNPSLSNLVPNMIGMDDEGPPDLSQVFPSDLELDLPIDDHHHTALHWAAALGRPTLASQFTRLGADASRGNAQGETPLMRSVLVTNSYDANAFPALLDILGPTTLAITDESNRTVLHHIALIASVKGRGASARYYMETLLEWVVRREGAGPGFADWLDALDSSGDTALNVAARVGSRALVRMLVECGADRGKANKLGLRPGDFGVAGEDLTPSPAEEALAALRQPSRTQTPTVLPLRKSKDVITSVTTLIDSLTTDFTSEIKTKSDSLERTRDLIRSATKELADSRRQVVIWKEQVTEFEKVSQRCKNLDRALQEEDTFDWTGRTEINGQSMAASPAFLNRGPSSTLVGLPAVQIQLNLDPDPPLPNNDTLIGLIQLRRMEAWYVRVLDLLSQRLERIQGASVEQEQLCRKIVSLCCGVELSQVDGMLDRLLVAMESDGPDLDLTRVAGFMNRVQGGTFG